MEKCKFCQSEIDEKAKVCPVCKRTLKGVGCLTYAISFVIVIGIIVFGVSMQNQFIQKELSGVNNDSEYITMSEFNQIEIGMTYDEVKEIVGSSGEITSQSGAGQYQITLVTWYGNGQAGSSANVTFTNGKVSGRAQFGLK